MDTFAAYSPPRCRHLATLLITLTLLTACDMNKTKLSGYMQELPPFDPHIASFECQTEAGQVPPIDAQADDWFLEARALEDGTTYVDDVDYKKVVRLTRQAAERHHWKAMLNLASLYVEGRDPPNGENEAVALVSQAIDLGVPAAYDRMGTYYLNGTGVNASADRAYVFFQKAAQMGNPQAMAFLGEKMDAGADNLKPGYWGNIPIAIKMFECALAQGYGPAAQELEYMYEVPRAPDGTQIGKRTPETLNRVMRAVHEGVKGGCEYCANNLASEFDRPSDLANMFVPFIDKARGQRYDMLGDALSFNPDRRFPNLDKILPLPPAPLPPWDGTRASLLAAAMAVVPAPSIPAPTEASLRKGRYFLDKAYVFRPIKETTDALQAPVAGYWQPTAPQEAAEVRSFLASIAPGLYGKGETFEQPRFPDGMGSKAIAGIVWQRVLTVRNDGGAVAPRTALRLSRQVQSLAPSVECAGNKACPVTGTWQPWVAPGHPLEQEVNQAWRQRWLTAGQAFPDPKRDWMLPLESADLKWHLLEREMAIEK
ncbi:tetratricopeptide repeat protein [Massilia sp. ST3]|uniref:tetratricopeptide repeat protein n=1 Tax=Massilia sp. ST3 TaxID=2824903 RepID=UPI001B8321BF|nr:tetratricopeptide repeat protein [Massilia sp. ST3]MBQ5946311.1 sel1 repeat family protein [Massilia sp. ST3]